MSNNLPIKVKMGVRDGWDNKDSPPQLAIVALRGVIGCEVTIQPQWQLLWAELQPHYPEVSYFVPNVGSMVTAWCKSMQTMLEDEAANGEWTEKVLENCVHGPTGLRVRLEVRSYYT